MKRNPNQTPSKTRRFFAALLALFALGMASGRAANAATLTVGMSGQYKTIQDAVNNANPGDTVLVADGTYTGPKNRDIDFGGIDLIVKSASGDPTRCLIDCQQAGRGFAIQNGETSASVIAGFTIMNGKTSSSGGGIFVTNNSNPNVMNCVFTNNTASGNGGGTYGVSVTNGAFNGNSAASSGGGMYGGTATNCTFTGNLAVSGGGGAFNITATNCTFTGNTAASNNNVGGGMESGTATNCTFIDNSAFYGGGMESGKATNCVFTDNSVGQGGGGTYSVTAINCTYNGNTAYYGGGAIYGNATNCAFINNASGTVGGGGTYSVTAKNCAFYYNTASGNSGGMDSGSATNCVFFGNTAMGNGGAVSNASLFYCTVAYNTAKGSYGGGIYNSGNLSAVNCVIWGNTSAVNGPNVKNDGGTLAITYSDVQRSYPGTGNINSDPLFVNATAGDLHLLSSSPCGNSGTGTAPSGFTLPTMDIDGGNRIIGNAADMGAYEYGNPGLGGTLTFAGLVSVASPQNVTFQLRPVGGGSSAPINRTVGILPNGAFRLYGLLSGKYTLWIKPDKFLANTVPVTVTAGVYGTVSPAPSAAGDANNDNSVDVLDFGVLVNAYGSKVSDPAASYDPTADFNGDGTVDVLDFGLLVNSYGDRGAL